MARTRAEAVVWPSRRAGRCRRLTPDGAAVSCCQSSTGWPSGWPGDPAGGLDPGGAWAPSRQRSTIPLPAGRTPVRREGPGPLPGTRPRQGRAFRQRRSGCPCAELRTGTANAGPGYPAWDPGRREPPRRRQTGEGRQKLTGNDTTRAPVGRVAVIIPTYNERENLEAIAAPGPRRGPGRRPAGRRRQQPGRHRRAGRQAGRRGRATSRCCTGRARAAWARPTSPASAGRWTRATAPWSRWTRTARTSPSSCPPC